MKRILMTALAAGLMLTLGCVPQGGDRDGDPGANLEPQPDSGRPDPNNGNGGPRVGGEVAYPNGISETDQVDELDAADRQAACDALEATFVDALPDAELLAFTCGFQALLFGAFDEMDPEGTCEMAYDACLANPEEFMTEEGDGECPLIEQPECTATLAEIEACISDGLGALLAFNDIFECALVNDVQDDPMAGADAGSAACEALEAKCPGLLDDDDPEDSTNATGDGPSDGP